MSALEQALRRYQRRLHVPAADARHVWHERRGVIVTLQDPAGHRGEGEAAPLPGVSPEDLDQVELALARASLAAPGEDEALDRVLAQVPATLPASARFALESALLSLWAERRGVDLTTALGGDPTRSLSTVALIHTLSPEALSVPAGWAGVKVKVGRPDQHQAELRFVGELRRRLRDDQTIRIDANQSFPRATVLAQLQDYAALGVELAEEPCLGSAALALAGAPLPIALDESLALPAERDPIARALDAGVVGALVLKPSLLGLANCLAWARRGPPAIVSHLYEGPIGRRVLLALAKAVPPGAFAHGLGGEAP